MPTLEDAIALAARAHAGQRDKAGAPYILHPLRVMLRLADEAGRIAAVLHDVVEDTAWTLDALRGEGYSEEVVAAVDALTKRPEEEDAAGDSPGRKAERYEAFLRRVAGNPLARRVKIADLQDNGDLARIPNPAEADFRRAEKYERGLALLRAAAGQDRDSDGD